MNDNFMVVLIVFISCAYCGATKYVEVLDKEAAAKVELAKRATVVSPVEKVKKASVSIDQKTNVTPIQADPVDDFEAAKHLRQTATRDASDIYLFAGPTFGALLEVWSATVQISRTNRTLLNWKNVFALVWKNK